MGDVEIKEALDPLDTAENVETIPEVTTLPPKKAQALEMLLQGQKVVDVAKTIGVHKTTLHRWMRDNEVFKNALKTQEELIIDDLYQKCLLTMYELLESDNPYSKQFVVAQLLKIKNKHELNINVKQEPLSNMTAEQLLQEL